MEVRKTDLGIDDEFDILKVNSQEMNLIYEGLNFITLSGDWSRVSRIQAVNIMAKINSARQ